MHLKNLIRGGAVGADESCLLPIHRPLPGFLIILSNSTIMPLDRHREIQPLRQLLIHTRG